MRVSNQHLHLTPECQSRESHHATPRIATSAFASDSGMLIQTVHSDCYIYE